MHSSLRTGLAVVLFAAGAATPPASAGETWRQVGFFRSDTRNLSVGKGEVRVVTAPDRDKLELTGNVDEDSAKVSRYYPGWDYSSDLVIHYRATPEGFRQESFEYASGVERKALPADPIAPNLGVFDHMGTRRAEIPQALRAYVGKSADVVAAAALDWDSDGAEEWVVGIAGTWDSVRHLAPVSIRFLDQEEGEWRPVREFEIRDSVRSGPLEVRDVTLDGEADFIYRYFHESLGHFWVDARIFSRHEGMPNVFLPAAFDPGIAVGPLQVR